MLFTWVSKNEQTRFGRGIAKAQAQDAPLPGVHDIQVQADSLWAAVRAPFHVAASAKQPRICANEPQHNEFLHIHILLTFRVHPMCRWMPPKSVEPLHDFALTVTQNTAYFGEEAVKEERWWLPKGTLYLETWELSQIVNETESTISPSKGHQYRRPETASRRWTGCVQWHTQLTWQSNCQINCRKINK